MSLPHTLVRGACRLIRKPFRIAGESVERWLNYQVYRYHWPHHVLFIAGLPKSGTTWIMQLLGAVPGYAVRWPDDPHNCVQNHDVCDAVFANMPSDLYSVVKLHTRFTPANLTVIMKYDLRTLVVYRDLRDQCVSRYFHVLYDPSHRHHAYYSGVSKQDGLSHCIEITRGEYMPWIQDWLPCITRHADRFHEVRYEDLRSDPCTVLSRVLDFYDIRLPAWQVVHIVKRNATETKFDLRANLRSGKSTARKGIVGDWRNHFTTGHVERFKEACGEFLVESGYEEDLDWNL